MTSAPSGIRALLPAAGQAGLTVLLAQVVTATTTEACVDFGNGRKWGPWPLVTWPTRAAESVGDHGDHSHDTTAPAVGSTCLVFRQSLSTAYVLPVNGVD